MRKAFAYCMLKLAGWKITGYYPALPKSVCVMAPHTSMWDFVWGKLYFMYVGLKPRFLIKKEMFKWPLGFILKALGGIPVDRSKPNDLIDNLINKIEEMDSFLLVITPEGTRKRVDVWKTGAIRIAKRANVPLVVGKIDYKQKELDVLRVFDPVPGDKNFINELKLTFAGVTGKHPEKFNPYAKQ
ncbi:MAG: 1-acyl-sn-glycerol-3-phosphate acyltransferase [Bacteroidales bacterium]